MTETRSPTVDDWRRRLEGVGAAQGRYLLALLISCLFYLALAIGDAAQGLGGLCPAPVIVPIIQVEITRSLVLATGPFLISFLSLCVLGSLRAVSAAWRAAQLPEPAEWADPHPDAIDLAVYTGPQTRPIIQLVASLSYPVALLLAVTEAFWLALYLYSAECPPPAAWLWITLGSLAWIPAVRQLVFFIANRIARAFPKLQRWHQLP